MADTDIYTGPLPQGVGLHQGAPLRGGISGALIISDAHGRYFEATSRGAVFATANQTGVTIPAGLSTAPTTVTLFNPKGSGVYGVILYAGLSTSIAPAAAQVIWIGANTNIAAADVTGTVATVRNCLIGNSKAPAISALTAATLPVAPVAIATLGVVFANITAAPEDQPLAREFAGALVLLPGGALSFQGSSAGGASGSWGEWVWEEVPIV